jgi:hypothetical protein
VSKGRASISRPPASRPSAFRSPAFGSPGGRLAALLLPLALGACANPHAGTALAARDLLAGMPAETLLSCAGVPERRASIGETDFFTYENRSTIIHPYAGAGFITGRPWFPGWSYGPPAPIGAYDVYDRGCEATFTLRNGRVERVVYSGQTPLCHAIVANCLAQTP